MRRFLFLACLVAPCIALAFGCGQNMTPKDTLAAADQAYRSEKDYTKAMKLYRSVLDWQGEGAPTNTERFQASLDLIRCQIASGEYDHAVSGLAEMQKIYKDAVTFKNYGTVIGDLMDNKATSQAIEVLTMGAQAFPDKKSEFESWVKKLEQMNLSDDQVEKLKKLGYL